ncbi:TPA: sel1 repeat family protein, partial [Enterobacter hormaechei subsp. xiangfangensis]|nr:sel1 repeat family protein [Enterobacter hormaechei subsp. xiangfangensis]
RGQFSLTGAEHLRMSQQLIDARVATGYYFVAIFLKNGAAGLQQDTDMALRYYRKAADEGSAQAQAYVGDILAGGTGNVPNIARQMRRCAAEQGEGEAASDLGVNLQGKARYQEALEAFQLGVAAGDDTSASFLASGFNGPAPSDTLDYLGQQKDAERSRRYKAIWKMLADYSYLHPSVPEINDIVPLPPAPLPVWDGKLKWIEDYKANIEPPKPGEALIERLAKDRQLNPATGRPLPASPDFEKNAAIVLLCKTGEPCPKSGYWQIARLPREGVSQNAILMFKEGDIMPADVVDIYRARPWPFSDKHEQQEQHVEWRFLTEA